MLRVFLLSAVDSLIFQRLYRKIMATDTNYTARLEQVVKKKNSKAYAGSGTLAVHFEDLRICNFADSSAVVPQLSVTITTAVIRCWKRDRL